MKKKTFTQKSKLITLILALLLICKLGNAVEIVNFPLNVTYQNSPASYSSGNSGVQVLETATGSVTYDNLTGANVTGWNSTIGKNWYTTAINTSNFYSITVTGQAKSTSAGPRDFKLQYSLNNTDWVDAGNLPELTSDITSFGSFNLPDNCSFQSTLYIRLATRSLTAAGGGTVTAVGNSALFGLVIAGEELLAPTTQTSNITLVAVTPTTITIGCSQGTGNARIIKMNTSNSFTNPVDNVTYTGNPNYTSGEQVIYAGTGTKVTITVPSSANEYWFRAYDYNELNGQTRYLTSTAVSNPKQCLLETVVLPTVTDIRLTKATLGGTITSGPSGTIIDRGIYWSLNPGVTIGDNKVSAGGTDVGVFTTLVTNLQRSTETIYFKAYVENLSGTSISEEATFSNIPIFSGTGNWENASFWNVLEVPGSANSPIGDLFDSPVINGTCTISSSDTECNNLTINSGRKLIINPLQSITPWGVINNNAGTSGILVKSSSTLANGSFIVGDNFTNTTVQGTVEMYSKASWNLSNEANNKYRWQYFGIPVQQLSYSSAFGNCFVREWDESVMDYYDIWAKRNDGSSLQLNAGSTLTSGKGYELVQASPKTYTFSGNLVLTDFSVSLPYSSNAYYPGQHVLSNPYTAAMNIEFIEFNQNTEQSIYLYNTGSYTEWENGSGETTPGNDPGQYTVTTPQAAGGLGVPSQIPSMQGFLIKSTGLTGQINFPFWGLTKNTNLQRVKKTNTSASKVITRIDVKGNKFSDRMWIFTDSNCSRKFDNGWDGKKILGSSFVSQLYAMESDGNYQINAVNDMNNSYIGFQPGNEKEFTLTFTHQNSEIKYSEIYLIDLVNNQSIDISKNGTEYTFTSSSNDPVKRFKIVTKSNDTTIIDENNTSPIKISNSNLAIFIENFNSEAGQYIIYNSAGLMINKSVLNSNSITVIPTTNLNKGIYILKANINKIEATQRIIIR
jgi:hypothetical protein